MRENDIIELIQKDAGMMRILARAERLGLPDWIIGAGFVRNKVWNHLHSIQSEGNAGTDIDLIYFDRDAADWEADAALSRDLSEETGITWEIKNQAYMHVHNGFPPFQSAADGMAHWVETATAIGVRLDRDRISLIAPHGIHDLVHLKIRKTPGFPDSARMEERVVTKKWMERWPKLTLELE